MLKMRPLHDGDGRYYMGRCCPECGTPVGGIIAPTEDGNLLREDLRDRATKDPNPERWDLENVPTV
jgi:hypothetical protein